MVLQRYRRCLEIICCLLSFTVSTLTCILVQEKNLLLVSVTSPLWLIGFMGEEVITKCLL